ncbi:hypothetical protein QBC35DRAFT_525934 [Podospora australis]|uniref:Cellobiose dehydrogenase-like cytochrome domain-containing protein n=1 Tax=Podospora australis TaxID=1536484 RepID=A0AAN6WLC3_9PEZI|nr:hypothetical protein QBC35DRAFT_525934 [Podospora australis]
MGLLHIAATALALNGVSAVPAPQGGNAPAAKYCDASTTICYSEWVSPEKIAYRVAIPENATATADFDVLLQIQAPSTVGWAGIAWGGVMVNNPLTVAWPSGQSVVVSSRLATARTYPTAYAGATYTVLPGTVANSTHWTLNVLAKGVTKWGSGAGTRLNPSSTAVSFAYAQSRTGPSEPANNQSRFGIHNSRAKWSHNLAEAKISDFAAQVAKLSGTAA